MSVEQQILLILQKSQETRLHDLVELTGASRQMVHRAVKSLAQRGLIEKLGSAPRTYYRQSVATRIIGLAITGSFKGFDVIQEV